MFAVRVIVLLLPLLASGCIAAAGMAVAPATAIGTTVASGKTPVDHIVSLISGKNCSVHRNRQGLTYCVEDERQPPVRVVCYHTLGDVACYDRPNPYNGRQRAIVEDLGVTSFRSRPAVRFPQRCCPAASMTMPLLRTRSNTK